jgi:hypothetical protein
LAFSHCKDFRGFFPFIYVDESLKGKDVWWEFAGAVDGLIYLIRRIKLTCSPWIGVDKTMCAWRPRTTALGGLSFILDSSTHPYFLSQRNRIENNGLLFDRCDMSHGNPSWERRHEECQVQSNDIMRATSGYRLDYC